jgi:hydroxymethylbilane synthase
VIRLGTRGSLLARTQSGQVAAAIEALVGEAVELVVMRTEGDDVTIPLDAPPRPGAFVATLRDALAAGGVDVVVHSFKDLPSAPLPGLTIAAVPARVDPRDALISRDGHVLASLPSGATVGTSSPRRAAALLRARPDLRIVGIRGNVDTRLRKVADGELDATILAVAGLCRLERAEAVTEYLDPILLLPAPAQGALAIECREGALAEALRALDDPASGLAVAAERAVLAGIQATCTTAVGALATASEGGLTLRADLDDARGHRSAVATTSLAAGDRVGAVALGHAVAAELLGRGR